MMFLFTKLWLHSRKFPDIKGKPENSEEISKLGIFPAFDKTRYISDPPSYLSSSLISKYLRIDIPTQEVFYK